mgnify:CR=1 FL=1
MNLILQLNQNYKQTEVTSDVILRVNRNFKISEISNELKLQINNLNNNRIEKERENK